MKLLVALCGRASADCRADDGTRLRVDYRLPNFPTVPDAIDPDAQQHRIAVCESDLPDETIETDYRGSRRVPKSLDTIPAPSWGSDAIDDTAVHDSQPVCDQLRRFGAWPKSSGGLHVDVWAIVAVCDASGRDVAVERIATSGLPVSGESAGYSMPQPILSPERSQFTDPNYVQGMAVLERFLRRLAESCDCVR
jgi:hypothetical protein